MGTATDTEQVKHAPQPPQPPTAIMVMTPDASNQSENKVSWKAFFKSRWKCILILSLIILAAIVVISIPATFFSLRGSSMHVHVGDVHINSNDGDSSETSTGLYSETISKTTVSIQKLSSQGSLDCNQYTNEHSCSANNMCDWNEFEYKCMPRFEVLEDNFQQQCSTRYTAVETKEECSQAGKYFGLSDNSVSVRHYDTHPPGCYFFNNHLHLNQISASEALPLSDLDINNFQTLCTIKPGHCFNNVVDCKEGEFAVDCGDVCKKECTTDTTLCTTTTSPPYCKKAVQYSDSGWTYQYNKKKKNAYTKLMGIDCKSAEETYDTNFGKCVINANGELYIDVRNFPDTSSICNLQSPGVPVAYSDTAAPDDLCSYMYFTHPGGIPADAKNIPTVYTYEEFHEMSFLALRRELQCANSMDTIPEGESYYWEKCCFV